MKKTTEQEAAQAAPFTEALASEYVAPKVEVVMTEEALAREVKYAGDGTIPA